MLSVILPAYNEAEGIAAAVSEVSRVLSDGDEILVVDDGSTDCTAEIVSELTATIPNLRLLRHATNRGKGAAVRSGMKSAQGDRVAFLDCDLSVQPSTLLDASPLLSDADIVIGSRRMAGADIVIPQSFARQMAGQLFNKILRWKTGLPWRDTQCGFKIFSRHAVRLLLPHLTMDGWSFDVELLLAARATGLTVAAFPVLWRNRKQSRVCWSEAPRILTELHALSRRFPPV